MQIFSASVITGEGKGKDLGSPTFNLNLDEVPEELEEGVYAVWAEVNGERHPATMHYGPRPTLGFGMSCEVHILNRMPNGPSERRGWAGKCQMIKVEAMQKLREVQDFGNEEGLKKQIAEDIKKAKQTLGSAGSSFD